MDAGIEPRAYRRHRGRLGEDLGIRPDADFEILHTHGFSDEDIWDIGAITAFFGLSNRVANMSNMMPNPEFYLMGRVPRPKPDKPAA